MIRQQGATMAITLLLLFVITLLGVSSIQTTQIQEKMSANLQDKELSFAASESALAAGEAWVLGHDKEPTVYATCTAYPCVQDRYLNVDFSAQDDAWWQSRSAAYSINLSNIVTPPRYIIEYLQFVPDSPVVGATQTKSPGVHYYQITARGKGATEDAVSVLQTTVARRY